MSEDSQHVIHCCHVEKHMNPVTKCTNVYFSPSLEEMPSIEALDENEERIYSLYVCDVNGKLLKKLLFFESDYREALKRDLERRTG